MHKEWEEINRGFIPFLGLAWLLGRPFLAFPQLFPNRLDARMKKFFTTLHAIIDKRRAELQEGKEKSRDDIVSQLTSRQRTLLTSCSSLCSLVSVFLMWLLFSDGVLQVTKLPLVC